MNKLYEVIWRIGCTWGDDYSYLISAKDLDECKQLALDTKWKYYSDLKKAIEDFKEEDLNKKDDEMIIWIKEVENKSGILHIANVGV